MTTQRTVDATRPTKAAAREWARRCRESLRLALAALDREDWDGVEEWGAQAAGDGCEFQNILDAIREAANV
jgi:hypothetical protein